jgi:adenylylsulfate kinase
VLAARDQRGLYSRALRGEEKNVMGVDLPFEEPTTADLVVDNDGTLTPHDARDRIMDRLARMIAERAP